MAVSSRVRDAAAGWRPRRDHEPATVAEGAAGSGRPGTAGLDQWSVKPAFLWLPSQSGLFAEPPQRHSVTRLRTSSGSPAALVTGIRPVTHKGPSSVTAIAVAL